MSTIKVNKLEQRSGCTATVGGGSGKTVTVDATTITLGRCGGTVSLASGASQSGFGRTGTVDWCTTAKTSPFTAVSGDGFFINTTSGGVTVTLPSSPSAGDIIAIKDYAGTFDSNAVTICRNGSKINGACYNASLSTQGQSVTLIYVDGTKGWQDIHDSTSDITGQQFITATGGTITCCGSFRIHTFTASGCFAVTALASCSANNVVSYTVVAGGGGAGSSQGNSGGGGGGGGFREDKSPVDSYSSSPLDGAPTITLTAGPTTYPITVGAGGAGSPGSETPGTVGSNSIFSTVTSAGGGFGGGPAGPPTSGGNGGSGGGGGGGGFNRPGGTGNTPPVSPPQGQPGGATPAGPSGDQMGGGGGGAGAAGGTASPSVGGGDGGDGTGTAINPATGTPGPTPGVKFYSGGGGGGWYAPTAPSGAGGTGGAGGGGPAGSPGPTDQNSHGTAGTANTGGGAGAPNSTPGAAAAGGSGIVIIRYKKQ
jgi:hypothetical protein